MAPEERRATDAADVGMHMLLSELVSLPAHRQTPAGPWATGQRLHITPASFGKMQAQMLYPPSATAKSALLPFRPESSNPTKVIDDQSWKLYVVDLVRGS